MNPIVKVSFSNATPYYSLSTLEVRRDRLDHVYAVGQHILKEKESDPLPIFKARVEGRRIGDTCELEQDAMTLRVGDMTFELRPLCKHPRKTLAFVCEQLLYWLSNMDAELECRGHEETTSTTTDYQEKKQNPLVAKMEQLKIQLSNEEQQPSSISNSGIMQGSQENEREVVVKNHIEAFFKQGENDLSKIASRLTCIRKEEMSFKLQKMIEARLTFYQKFSEKGVNLSSVQRDLPTLCKALFKGEKQALIYEEISGYLGYHHLIESPCLQDVFNIFKNDAIDETNLRRLKALFTTVQTPFWSSTNESYLSLLSQSIKVKSLTAKELEIVRLFICAAEKMRSRMDLQGLIKSILFKCGNKTEDSILEEHVTLLFKFFEHKKLCRVELEKALKEQATKELLLEAEDFIDQTASRPSLFSMIKNTLELKCPEFSMDKETLLFCVRCYIKQGLEQTTKAYNKAKVQENALSNVPYLKEEKVISLLDPTDNYQLKWIESLAVRLELFLKKDFPEHETKLFLNEKLNQLAGGELVEEIKRIALSLRTTQVLKKKGALRIIKK